MIECDDNIKIYLTKNISVSYRLMIFKVIDFPVLSSFKSQKGITQNVPKYCFKSFFSYELDRLTIHIYFHIHFHIHFDNMKRQVTSIPKVVSL